MQSHDSTNEALKAALRAVAEDDERLGSSSAVSMRLLAEVHAVGRARRRRWVAAAAGVAAVLFVAILVPAWRAAGPERPQTAGALPVTRELVTEFFPLAYGNVPARGGYVVRMQVPRDTLDRFGAGAFDARHGASPTILADVVIGDDGLARAVRFVRVVNESKEQTP